MDRDIPYTFFPLASMHAHPTHPPSTMPIPTFCALTQVWEIYTDGDIPYPRIRNYELVMALLRDTPLVHEKPEKCPVSLYQILEECWSQDPAERPTYVRIRIRKGCISF